MTTTRSRAHPKATARSTQAYCLAGDSTCSTTCWGWDWRTYTSAQRCRWYAWSCEATPLTPRGCRAGSVIGHLLLVRKAVPGDGTSHDLAQTSPILRGQRGPERWQRHLLGARDLGGTERHRRGGALSGVHIRHLLTDRRADVDTTGTALTALIH